MAKDKQKQEYYRSYRGRIQKMWEGICKRKESSYHKFAVIEMSRDEFIDMALNSENYRRLHEEWVKSGYSKYLTPTPDRIDSTKGYRVDNLQFITFYENSCKGRSSDTPAYTEKKFVGVEMRKGKKGRCSYLACYYVKGKKVRCGGFDTAIEAANAVNEGYIQLGKEPPNKVGIHETLPNV